MINQIIKETKSNQAEVFHILEAESYFLKFNLKNINKKIITIKKSIKEKKDPLENCLFIIEIESYLYSIFNNYLSTINPDRLSILEESSAYLLQKNSILYNELIRFNNKNESIAHAVFAMVAFVLKNKKNNFKQKFSEKELYSINFYRNAKFHAALTKYTYEIKYNSKKEYSLSLKAYEKYKKNIIQEQVITKVCKKIMQSKETLICIKQYQQMIYLLLKFIQ